MTPEVEPPACLSNEAAIAHIFHLGQRALVARDLARAREVFQDVLLLDPENDLAKRALAAVDAVTPIPPSREVRLTRPPVSFLGESMPPDEAFVLSRLAAGPMRLYQLLQHATAAGRDADDVVAALDRLREDGAVTASA